MSPSRFLCIPKATGRERGLANECVPWAKACLAAQAIGAHCCHPAWGINRRQYWRHFGTSRLDFRTYRLIELIYPIAFTFDEQAYRANYDPDFGYAFANWVRSLRLPRFAPVVFFLEGMWGGYGALDRSRAFLLGELYRARNALSNVMTKLPAAGRTRRLRVGIHYRSGDFGQVFQTGDGHGRWNRRLPMSYYTEICGELKAALDPEFLLVTDAQPEECQPILDLTRAITTFDQHMTDVSDLLLLSQCDCIIPSLSSFSLTAIWLGSAAYVWPAEHAIEVQSFLTLWGDEEMAGIADTAETLRNIARVRANQVLSANSRAFLHRPGVSLPSRLFELLRSRALFSDTSTDLVRYGALPASGYY